MQIQGPYPRETVPSFFLILQDLCLGFSSTTVIKQCNKSNLRKRG